MTFSLQDAMREAGKRLRVAIIGGGFGGLATGAKLAPFCKTIHIYDPTPLGKASGSSAAAGLMHPLSPSGQLVWNGMDSFYAAESHLQLIAKITGSRFIYQDMKIVRTIFKETEEKKWKSALNSFSETSHSSLKAFSNPIVLLTKEELSKRMISIHPPDVLEKVLSKILSAYQINPSMIVNCEEYLKASWKAMVSLCADCHWLPQQIHDLKELSSEYEAVILAGGFGSPFLWNDSLKDESCEDMMLKKTHLERGITLTLQSPSSNITEDQQLQHSPLSAFLFGDYLVPSIHNEKMTLIGGATHDRITPTKEELQGYFHSNENNPAADSFSNVKEEEAKLRNDLRPILNHVDDLITLERRIGVRLKTANRPKMGRVPIVGRHPILSNVWIITGFGVRGLLYHALSADYLVEAIVANDETKIPSLLHPSIH